jgi:hypothetical protein
MLRYGGHYDPMTLSLKNLETRLRELTQKAEKLQAQYRDAMHERERVTTAIAVIREMEGKAAASVPDHLGLTAGQAAIYKVLGSGKANSLSPSSIHKKCVERGSKLAADYVRTTLWRMAQYGTIRSSDGLYWK